MPTFTRKLSDIVLNGFDLGLTQLEYPIFDENYRPKLNDKIIKHYWNYEIGQETESMFHFMLNRKMNEIMPIYNQLYLSTKITFDPMQSVNYTDLFNNTFTSHGDESETNSETNSETAHGTENTNSVADSTNNASGKARTVNSETPQVLLSPNEDYASSAANTISENDNIQNATTTGGKTDNTNASGEQAGERAGEHNDNSTTHNDRTVKGLQIPGSDLLMRYRATFLNIDMDVISELSSLFMLLWDNGDEYSNAGSGMGYGFSFIDFGIL